MSLTPEFSVFSFRCALLLLSNVMLVFNAFNLHLSPLFVKASVV